tara:strand:- start:173 stop:367 length:195 start_codon:yes stop_codon:yes gene_type:complete
MTLKVRIDITEGLLSNGATLYTVCWKRDPKDTGQVRLCRGTNNFKDDGLPPDVLAEVQKKLNLT